jgi:alpha-galactosidase
MSKTKSVAACAALIALLNAPVLAAEKPPMGWNSWDSFGTTITEPQFRDIAKVEADKLKPFGWRIATVDMEWFVRDPTGPGNLKVSVKAMDGYGRYLPSPGRFPSAADGKGFKKIADYVHSLGLKFGIHILRGIPKDAVDQNLPIFGSKFHAQDAANKTDTCGWNPDNYGVDVGTQAGKDYYKSLATLYASWGVDFVKADCMASRDYRSAEIGVLGKALHTSNHPALLSLSPGGAPMSAIDDLRKQAVMWRISGDVWDFWHNKFPAGVGDQFDRAAAWAPYTQAGHWPDADMLALGYLGPAPGHGVPRDTNLTPAEQQTYMTLWCIFRSPLMMGGNLSRLDAPTLALLTNPEVLAVDQSAHDARQMFSRNGIVAWKSLSDDGKSTYIALFNTGETDQTIAVSFSDLGLEGTHYDVRDLWQRKPLGSAAAISVAVGAHGSVLYKLVDRKA